MSYMESSNEFDDMYFDRNGADPRDEIIERNKREIEELNREFNQSSTELRNEIKIYAQRASAIHQSMFYRIMELEDQLKRKKELYETINAPYPKEYKQTRSANSEVKRQKKSAKPKKNRK